MDGSLRRSNPVADHNRSNARPFARLDAVVVDGDLVSDRRLSEDEIEIDRLSGGGLRLASGGA